MYLSAKVLVRTLLVYIILIEYGKCSECKAPYLSSFFLNNLFLKNIYLFKHLAHIVQSYRPIWKHRHQNIVSDWKPYTKGSTKILVNYECGICSFSGIVHYNPIYYSGPGSYHSTVRFDSSPSYSFGVRVEKKITNDVPSPNAYAVRAFQRSPAFSISSRHNLERPNQNPGEIQHYDGIGMIS